MAKLAKILPSQKNTHYTVSETVGTIHYNTQPVTVEEAVGLDSVGMLVGNGKPEDCVLAEKSTVWPWGIECQECQ